MDFGAILAFAGELALAIPIRPVAHVPAAATARRTARAIVYAKPRGRFLALSGDTRRRGQHCRAEKKNKRCGYPHGPARVPR
jgi:hypothetical protein